MQRWRRRSLDTDAERGSAALAYEQVTLQPELDALQTVYAGLDFLETQLQALLRDVEVVDDRRAAAMYDAYLAFKTATIEIATNILRHAYPPGYVMMPVTLGLQLFPNSLEATFYDQGVEYALPDEIEVPEWDDLLDMPEGNLGLFLARNALDVLDYTRTPAGVNRWYLVKRFK